MSANSAESRLLSLIGEALNTSLELRHFSEENFCIFSGDDEKKIDESLRERERLINILTGLEKEINLIIGSFNVDPWDKEFLSQFHEARRAIRSTLDAVSALDMEAVKLLNDKMQDYRDKTVRARNKKHISAYIKSGAVNMTDNKFDYLK
jgi:hypothetical protein